MGNSCGANIIETEPMKLIETKAQRKRKKRKRMGESPVNEWGEFEILKSNVKTWQ